MAWLRDPREMTWIDSATGQRITDLAMAQYGNHGGDYLQQLGTLGGLAIGAYNTTAASSNTLVSTYFLGAAPAAAPEPARTITAPVRDDEFTWLRNRVAEVCWRHA